MGRLSESSVVANKNKSHSITAQIDVPEEGANGVIIAQGGAFGGFALYAKDGKPAYCYNLFGLQRFKVYGKDPIPAGEHQVRMEFTYDGGGLGKGGDVKLYVDGEQVGEGRVDGTVPMLFSADETTDVGSDTATPVSDDYGPRTASSRGRWVQLDVDAAAEERLIGTARRRPAVGHANASADVAASACPSSCRNSRRDPDAAPAPRRSRSREMRARARRSPDQASAASCSDEPRRGQARPGRAGRVLRSPVIVSAGIAQIYRQ